jgi:hypothetical protein
MIEAFSACTVQRMPRRARISKPSSMAPSEGAGRSPKVLPMKHLNPDTPPSISASSSPMLFSSSSP